MVALVQQIALGVGVNGALVDVTSYVTGPEGVGYSYGRQDEFRDPSPGQLNFILDNYDGRFTPGNPSSPLATLLTEGTAVCWKLGARLVTGVVSAIGFAGSEDQWGRVSITVGDSSYIAGRTQNLPNLAAAILMGAGPYMFWPFSDPAGSAQALELSGNNGPALRYLPDPVDGTLALTFGTASAAPTGDNQLSVVATNLSQSVGYSFGTGKGPKVTYPAGSLGAWGFWYTPGASSYLSLNVLTNTANYSVTLTGWTAQVVLRSTTGASLILPASTSPMYVSLVLTYDSTNLYATLNVNGVALQTVVQFAPGYNSPTVTIDHVLVLFTPNSGGLGTYQTSISHLSHTAALVHEEWAGVTSEANRWAALTSIVPQIVPGPVDPNLSAAQVATQSTSGSNAWAALLDLLRTEQGHIYNTTTGTLTAPTTVTNFRARTRPTAVKASFDAQLEVDGVPQFVRDVTNMLATITAAGPTNSATVTDPAAVARVGSASTSETVVLATPTDLIMYAQDRLVRGENVALRIVSVTIDLRSTPTDRSTDLLGLAPGDRIRITSIPSATLGFSTWDGWFLGASETHNYQSNRFTLFLAPVLPPTGIFDTDLYAAGGNLSLSASLTAAATSMTVVTADPLTFLETVQVPYALYVDREQVTVTACTAPSGGIQTATITRGAGGTTAATHASGALVDVAASSIYAF